MLFCVWKEEESTPKVEQRFLTSSMIRSFGYPLSAFLREVLVGNLAML